MRRKYVVIGHDSESMETACWLVYVRSQREARSMMKERGYVVYAVLSSDKFGEIISYGVMFEKMECVKKMVSSHRYAKLVYAYISDHSKEIAKLFNSQYYD